MRKMLVALTLSASLFLAGLLPATAEAGGGGRSYSSGSRSGSSLSGRSYSSGSRPSPSKPAVPTASSPRGKSYSSGPATTPSKPAAPVTTPSSSRFSSGSAPSTGTPSRNGSASAGPSRPSQKPGGNTYDANASTAQRKAASKEALSGHSVATPRASQPHPPTANGTHSSGSVSGRTYASSGSGAATTTDKKPTAGSYDTSAAAVERRQESKAVFTKGQQPRSTWTDSRNQTHPIDPRDRQIESLRRQLDYERWVSRETRQRTFYGDYYWRPALAPVVVYHDPYSSFFWAWLLAQSLDQRANWAYHHRSYMDEGRYRDLLAHDAQLEGRIRQLETQQVPRDASYVPQGMDAPDLMYRDEYVTAAYNPQPRPSHVLGVLLKVCFVISIMTLVIWLVFFKRWGGTER